MTIDLKDRYSRQMLYREIGCEGQEKLKNARVLIIGLGALGSASANELARAGVGYLRLVDQDTLELSNLQRQVFYTETQAKQEMPKAEAALQVLQSYNSEIQYDAIITSVSSDTIDDLLADIDLVIDATDNLKTRLLINEACKHHHIPWIYGGAAGAQGMTKTFFSGESDPCLACVFESNEDAKTETCSDVGVLSMTTTSVASLQCVEALKILTGSKDVRKTMLSFDLWHGTLHELPVSSWDECPVCKHQYSHYKKR